MGNRPFAALLQDVDWGWSEEEARELPCPSHSEKVVRDNLMDALTGLMERCAQPRSHITSTYKCRDCHGWHYTSRPLAKALANPFPRPFWYGVVKNGAVVWQSRDQRAANRRAFWVRGVVVPFVAAKER